MPSDLDLLRHLNPVNPHEAASWTETESAQRSHAQLIERIAEQRRQPNPDPYDMETRPLGFAVVVAILLAAAITVPLLIVGRPPAPEPPPPNPEVSLGLSYVWSQFSGADTPVEVGQAFAAVVLDWDSAVVTPRPDVSVGDLTWVYLHVDELPGLWILTEPKRRGSTAIVQVGTELPFIDKDDNGVAVVRWPNVPGSVSADINAWSSGTPHNTVELAQQDINRGSLDANQVARGTIFTILVRYRDSNGNVITASGGLFDPPTPAEAPQLEGAPETGLPTATP